MQPPEAAVNQSAGASPSRPEPMRQAEWLTLVLLFAAGISIRLESLAGKPFWFDECFSAEVARIRWPNFLHLLWWREANMSLYYLLLRIWVSASPHMGQSEFFLRSLSVLITAATLPAMYWLARLLYDRRVALIAAALFTFNAYSVRYAQEARSYALFVLLATLSSGCLISWLREGSSRYRRAFIVISILAAYAHFYALLLFAAEWLALRQMGSLGFSSDQQIAIPAQIKRSCRIIGLGVLPLLVFVAKTGAGPIRWIPRPRLHDLLEFYEHLAGGGGWPLPAIYAVACIAAVAPVGKGLLVKSQNWQVWRCQFLLWWFCFPVGLTVLLSFARPVFLARYMIFCLPPLLILVAAGLARLRQTWMLAAALVCILFLCSQGIFFVYRHDFDSERDASGAAASFILDHTLPGDAVIFHIAETRVPYEFFRSIRAGENTASPGFTAQLGPEIIFPRHAAGLDYRDFTGKPTVDFVRTQAAGYPRVWVMLMNNGPSGHPDPTTAMLTRTLPESFPKIMRWRFPLVEVRLYSKQ